MAYTPTFHRRTPPSRLLGSGLIPTTYESRATTARDTYGHTMGGLAGEEGNMFRDYGFTGTIDPTTGQASYSVDPTAHFGQYQTWLKGLGDSLAGSRADAVSRGLGGRGLSQARTQLARFSASQQQSDMMNNFQNLAHSIFNRRGEALTTQNRDIGGIEGEALDWWNQYGPQDADPAPWGTGHGRMPTPAEIRARQRSKYQRGGYGEGGGGEYGV